MLAHLPPHAVIAHYAQTSNGWAVVTASKTTLAPSFYDLRDRYTFFCSINGAGFWVVMVPNQPPASQPALF